MHTCGWLIDTKLPAAYQAAIEAILRRLVEEHAVQRLWAHDPSLWHPAASTQARIIQQLGWLDLPRMIPEVEAVLRSWHSAIIERQMSDILYVAPGMLGYAARLWQACFEPAAHNPQLYLLDSADPVTVQQQLAKLEPERTCVMLASPSDTLPAEALSRIVAAMGEVVHLPLPADVGARFATLSAPGLGLAMLLGLDFGRLHERALSMYHACQQPHLAVNPGFRLGASLGVLAQQGRDILLLIASPSLAPLAAWIEALLGGALSKHQRGFVPIVTSDVPSYREDMVVLHLCSGNQQDTATTEQLALLEQQGLPLLRLSLADSYDLAAQVVLWQVAVAVAAMVIGLNPFDAPDTEVLSLRTRQILACSMQLPAPAATLTWEAIRDAVPVLRMARFVAIVAYLPRLLDAQMQNLRSIIAGSLDVPVTIVYPLGDATFSLQLLHAGRPSGVVLVLSSLPDADVPVPGTAWSLSDLQRAQFWIEAEAWEHMRRLYVQINLGAEPSAELQRLCQALAQALAQ